MTWRRPGVETRFGPPDAVLHLDFHPDNIMLTPDGPVVFDWTNGALGPPAADVASGVAHLGDVHGRRLAVDAGVVRLLRGRLVEPVRRRLRPAAAQALLPAVAEYRLTDRNVRPEEADRIRALVASLS